MADAEHSERFERVRGYYLTVVRGKRLWDENRVKLAVKCGWITEAEMAEILKEA